MPQDDPTQRSQPTRQFPNAGLMAGGSPFVDENGANPFSDADTPETAAVEPGENNAYAANYAAAASSSEQDEYRIRLAHRGGTLLLVATFSALMLGLSFIVGPASMLVVICLGLWCALSALADLNAMKVGRMEDIGRRQTRAAMIISAISVLAVIAIIVRWAM